jgi:hypothetical protein
MKRFHLLTLLSALFITGLARAQYPIVDMVANGLVEKYQFATCEQLWAQRAQPKSPEEQQKIAMLRNDPQIRTYFINKVAAPIVNKMFECGMIP